MGARRLTNKTVAEKASVGEMTVSKIRNGNPRVGYMTLKRVVEALGLTMAEVSRPLESVSGIKDGCGSNGCKANVGNC